MVDNQDNQQRAAKFAPRDRQAEPETRRIRASLLFLGLGVLLTFGTVLWLGLFNQQDEIRLEISDLKVDETGDLELTGAIYRGQTARGEPFEITANVARERENGVVDLSSPTAQLRQASGDVMDISSATGVYQPAETEIELCGDDVITSRDTGLVMTAQAVQANLEAGNMISETPVRVESDNGVIVSKGMLVTERGKMIIFTGKTRMTIHNGAKGLWQPQGRKEQTCRPTRPWNNPKLECR